MMDAKGRFERIRPTHCYRCDAPVFINSIELPWDWKVKLIPYCFYTNRRHLCTMYGVPIEDGNIKNE